MDRRIDSMDTRGIMAQNRELMSHGKSFSRRRTTLLLSLVVAN